MEKRKKKEKREQFASGLDIFETSCALMRDNWRYCLEITALFLIFLLIVGGGWYYVIATEKNICLLGLLLVVTLVLALIFAVGKNKNFLSVAKGLGGGRYPFWSIEYFFSAWRLLMVRAVIWSPLIIGGGLGLFFWLISPSTFWLCLCVGGGIAVNAWLQWRLGIAEIALSVNQKMKLDEGLRASLKMTEKHQGRLLGLYLLNVLFLLTAGIFLPGMGLLLLILLISFEKVSLFLELNK